MCRSVPCDHPGINSRAGSFMFPDLLGTVPSPCVLVCVQALHNNTNHKAALPELQLTPTFMFMEQVWYMLVLHTPTQTTYYNRTVYNTSTGVCMVLGIHLHTSTPQFHQNHCLSHTQIHVHETCLVQACLTLYKIPPPPPPPTPTHVQFNATCTVCRHIHACTTKHHSVLCPTCSLVLITSIGVLPKTLAAPASPPLRKVFTGPMSFALSPCWKCFFKVLYTKKRMAWLVPCFSMVGTSPW